MQSNSENEYLKQIYHHMKDGIIIMKENREIIMINPAGQNLTGWHKGGFVPYCSYCTEQAGTHHKPSCYLIANKDVLGLLSKMPTYQGNKIDVEMSVAAIYVNKETSQTEYMLVLRDHETHKQVREAAINKKMIRALIEAKEEEHKRLAQELHDGVGQSLFSVSLALQAIESFVQQNDKLIDYIDEVREELQKVMNDVKNYAYQLRPQSLDQLGLEPTIRYLIDLIQRKVPNLEIQMKTQGLGRCDPAVEINLYRIIQEALHNITKYAQATLVVIDLIKDNTHVYMTIKDNGIGFDRNSIQSEGLGLKHIEERVDQLGGTCKIISNLARGTTIEIVIPRWRPKND
ncbi:histidine kinase [Lysinibacillus sp. FSL H8-0500]|uniref:sensor histidine kinase n=1 Tax=Lysinibacillus sp. FSL H8-0500 TaxID=2921393 RepID=UPI0031018BC3